MRSDGSQDPAGSGSRPGKGLEVEGGERLNN